MSFQQPMSRRRFLTSSALAAGSVVGAGALLGACDTGTTTSNGKSVVTLTVMYASNEFTKDYIAEFEKNNPDIKISFVEYDDTRLNAMIASGNPPDFIRGAAIGSANQNAKGLALALDPYLEKSSVLKRSDLLDINNAFRWDGKQTGQGPYYGICKDWSLDATLWYNGSLLEKAGIAAPSTTDPITYDQLFSMAEKLTVKSGGKTQVYGFGAEWAWNLIAPIFAMVGQQGGQLYNSDFSQIDFTIPAAKKAIEWYINFASAGIGPSSLNPLPDGSDQSTFVANRMGLTQDGYWFGGNFTSDANMQKYARLIPAPQMGSNRFSPCYAGQGAWISAKSKHPDEAWRLMEYFMTGTPAMDRAKSGWGIPALKSLQQYMPQDMDYQKEAFASTQNELKYVGLIPDSPYASISSYNTIIDKYIQQAVKKQISPDTACQQITQDCNKVLVQGKQQLG
ncbi:MAG TPA: extracellular solute-binding protein [Ktedonobacteraceae bacterium]|nr:extracellular solute-binding protein [Ktedonobacteraceae bacterium]